MRSSKVRITCRRATRCSSARPAPWSVQWWTVKTPSDASNESFGKRQVLGDALDAP